MRSVAKRKAGLQPIKRYSHGGRNDHDHDADGNPVYTPNKADTLRLVNANQAQIQELLDQGYVEYDSEPVSDKEIQIQATRKNRGLFASNSLDVSDIEKAIINKPWLATTLIPTRTLDAYDLSSGFFEDVIDSIERFAKEANLSGMKTKISEVRGKIRAGFVNVASGQGQMAVDVAPGFEVQKLLADLGRRVRAKPEVGEFGYTPNAAIEKAQKDINKAQERRMELYKASPKGSPLKVGDDLYNVNPIQKSEAFTIMGSMPSGDYYSHVSGSGKGYTNTYNYDVFVAAMSVANPGAIDYDEYKSLLNQGYQLFDDSFLQQSSFSADRAAAKARNLGRNVYNTFFGEPDRVEVIDKGDLGRETKVTKGEKLQLESVPGTKISGFTNIYPVRRNDMLVRKVQFFPPYNQREFLDGRFYLDREAEGTGAVRRDDLVKTLFNYDITPNRKILFFNKELNDIVSVYSYDSPEFRRYGDDPGDEEGGGGGGGGGGRKIDIEPLEPRGFNFDFNIDAEPRFIIPSSPLDLSLGRVPIQIGALGQYKKGSKQGGQKLDREYYYDPVARQYKEREVDEERIGGPVYGPDKLYREVQAPKQKGKPVYGGRYQFSTGGTLLKRRKNPGMQPIKR